MSKTIATGYGGGIGVFACMPASNLIIV